jgi:Spy/CpxP family protein refolding chaperone
MRQLMKPIRPQLDSLRQSGRRQILDLLTPAQRERFQARMKAEQEKAPARRNPHCDS